MITKEELSRCLTKMLPFSPPANKVIQYNKIITSLYKRTQFLTFKTRFIEQGLSVK